MFLLLRAGTHFYIEPLIKEEPGGYGFYVSKLVPSWLESVPISNKI